jgi:hypothetical protein
MIWFEKPNSIREMWNACHLFECDSNTRWTTIEKTGDWFDLLTEAGNSREIPNGRRHSFESFTQMTGCVWSNDFYRWYLRGWDATLYEWKTLSPFGARRLNRNHCMTREHYHNWDAMDGDGRRQTRVRWHAMSVSRAMFSKYGDGCLFSCCCCSHAWRLPSFLPL